MDYTRRITLEIEIVTFEMENVTMTRKFHILSHQILMAAFDVSNQ